MRHLKLLRRLSMRGNPLGSLDELSLSGHVGDVSGIEVASAKERQQQHQNATLASLKLQLGRLHETYPELARAFLSNRFAANENEEPVAGPGDQLLELLSEISNVAAAAANAPAEILDESLSSSLIGTEIPGSTPEESDEFGEPIRSKNSSSMRPTRRTQVDLEENSIVSPTSVRLSLGHFEHLQDLDLGECQLVYIKWTTLQGLSSLKKLQLDGNRLR